MFTMELRIKPKTEKKLRKIIAQSPDQERFAEDIIAFQIHELQRANKNIERDLHELEQRHNMTSAEFYRQYNKGVLGDDETHMLWAGLCELLQENQAKLKELK